MKVKAIDIARRMGISKATVSLALNGKPGVSEEKRALILKCKEEMEQQLEEAMNHLDRKMIREQTADQEEAEKPSRKTGRMIKVIMFDRKLGILCDSALNIWTEVLRIFDAEARKQGYEIGIAYVGAEKEEIERVVEECASPNVAGVILYGTEMKTDDFHTGLRAIRKPMVIFDFDAGRRYHSIIIDNELGAQKAVEFLAGRGCKKIEYLSQKIEIYNFERRRAGFVAGIWKAGLKTEECPIIPVGTTIESVDSYMQKWLEFHPLPDAFLMENYQVSIGVIKALQTLNINIPGQVSLIGIDELPSYMTGNVPMDCVRLEHKERAYMTMDLLLKEIENSDRVKFKIAARCELVPGETVR